MKWYHNITIKRECKRVRKLSFFIGNKIGNKILLSLAFWEILSYIYYISYKLWFYRVLAGIFVSPCSSLNVSLLCTVCSSIFKSIELVTHATSRQEVYFPKTILDWTKSFVLSGHFELVQQYLWCQYFRCVFTEYCNSAVSQSKLRTRTCFVFINNILQIS